MKVITTNLLNRFWKNGIKPIKDALAGKLDTSRIVNSLLTTEAGFALDARQGKELKVQIDELNSKLSNMCDGGTVSITAVLNSVVTLTIPFNKTFVNPPAFVCQVETGQVTADKMSIKSITNKRAEVFIYTSSASHAVKVHWNAVSLDY